MSHSPFSECSETFFKILNHCDLVSFMLIELLFRAVSCCSFDTFLSASAKTRSFLKGCATYFFVIRLLTLTVLKSCFHYARPPTCCQHFTPNFQAKRENTKTHMLWLCYNFHSEIYTSFFFQTVLLLLCFVVVN